MHALATSRATEPELAEPVIQIVDACKAFRLSGLQTEALDHVSLDVRAGEVVALLGPSGCGKTTLLNLVAGLLSPDSGQASYRGRAIDGPNSRVGYLTQDDALLPWRTVASNIALPLEIKGKPSRERLEQAEAMIERVGLKGFSRHYPRQLSGGMRKRASLGRTLIYQPETLLLDEPFGALDAQTRVMMQRELLRLVRSLNLTVLLVTHDLNEAIALADRVVLFSRRPARILDVITLPRREPGQVGQRLPDDDRIFARLWDQLALELGAG